MYSFIKEKFFLSHNQKILNTYNKLLSKVNELETNTKKLTDGELIQKTDLFKKRYLDGESLDNLLPEAFSAVVVDVANGQSDAAKYKKNGNIKVDSSGDIFIYVE